MIRRQRLCSRPFFFVRFARPSPVAAAPSTSAPNDNVNSSTSASIPAAAPSTGAQARVGVEATNLGKVATAHGGGFTWQMLSSWQRGLFTALGAAMGIGGLVYIFWVPLRSDTVHQTTIMASEALTDVHVKKQAVVLTKEIVRDVLQDESSVKLLTEVVGRLLAKKETRRSVALFLKSTFEDNYTQEITRKFVLDVVTSEWVYDKLLDVLRDLVIDLLDDPKTRAVMTKFLLETTTEALRKEELHRTAGRAVRASLWSTVAGQ